VLTTPARRQIRVRMRRTQTIQMARRLDVAKALECRRERLVALIRAHLAETKDRQSRLIGIMLALRLLHPAQQLRRTRRRP
jgi:hypothetical protein